MNRFKKIVSLLLVSLMLFSFAACADNGGAEAATSGAQQTDLPAGTQAEVTTASPYDENGYLLDNLDSSLNFGGNEYNTLYWSDVENQEFFAEDQTGEMVNDSIFKRNATVESRLNVTLKFTGIKGNYDNLDNYVTAVRNSVNGGDAYDILAAYSLSLGMCAYNGLTIDLLPQSNLDFTMPWWQKSLTDTATIGGKLYFASGDISSNMLYMMYVMFYNKEMIEDNKLDDPFSYVENGKWTVDKMIEMSEGLYMDLDNSGSPTAADQFGQAGYLLHAESLMWGSDIVAFDNVDGVLQLDEDFAGERNMILTDKLHDYFYGKDYDAYIFGNGDYKKVFCAGRSLFIIDRADIAVFDLNDKQFEMGILPLPKFDEDQEEYKTVTGNPFTLYGIPVNAPDTNASSAILECLASESYRTVSPAIFEICLKARYASGGNDVKSYDILRNGVVYDLGRILNKTLTVSSPAAMFQNQLKSNAASWTVIIKSSQKPLNKSIEQINAAMGGTD